MTAAPCVYDRVMRVASILLIGTSLGAASDVVPHCGGPKVVIQKPGEMCGVHGSRWRGECNAPAQCINVRDEGDRCTMPCKSDDECARLAPGLMCTAWTVPEGRGESKKVCSTRLEHMRL